MRLTVRGDLSPLRHEASVRPKSQILCQTVVDLFPDSVDVRALGLSEVGDQAIWDYAKETGLTIVSQDVDFAEMATLLGPPPKVIWLRAGNQSTSVLSILLRRHAETITTF